MTFRFQSRHVFLTYAQCNLGHNTILSELRQLEDFTAYTASTELHQDGNPHVHVLLRFTRKLSHRDNRRWDILSYHPNIVCPRAVQGTRDYIKKAGNFTEEGWETEAKAYSKCLEESHTKSDFLNELRTHHTRDYVLNYDRIVSMAEQHFTQPVVPYTPQFTQFLPCTPLNDWVNSSLVS